MTRTYTTKEINDIEVDSINSRMSNFEILKIIRSGMSIDTVRAKCNLKTYEVKERITAAQNGIEWLPGMRPKTPEEQLKKITDMIDNEYRIHLDTQYQNWYADLSNLDKNELGVKVIKDIMKSRDITYYNSDESGIQFILPDGRKCVVHALGDDLSGFVIHDVIDKLKGDIFIYVNDMKYRSHKIYIMTKHQIISKCMNRGSESDPQKMVSIRVLREHENMYNILRCNEE
jgi:hypothetical protein